MTIKTFRGMLPIGLEEKIHLSTNDGLTGYRINKFQIISNTPGGGNAEFIGKIRLTSDSNISVAVDFNDPDLLAVAYLQDHSSSVNSSSTIIIFDNETFNQDIFVNIVDAGGETVPCNYYIELEQMKLDLNHSTYITIKNIRSRTQV